MEQWWGLLLLYCLVLLNNPLFPAGVYTTTAAFPVLFAVFEGFFMSVWLLYCLLYLDMVRLREDRVFWGSLLTILKVAAVVVYFILSVALYMWQEVLLVNDPILQPSTMIGPSILFYIVALTYTGEKRKTLSPVLAFFLMSFFFSLQRWCVG